MKKLAAVFAATVLAGCTFSPKKGEVPPYQFSAFKTLYGDCSALQYKIDMNTKICTTAEIFYAQGDTPSAVKNNSPVTCHKEIFSCLAQAPMECGRVSYEADANTGKCSRTETYHTGNKVTTEVGCTKEVTSCANKQQRTSP